ncbi:UNVERIFIED_CONTAM: hypothetical protein PYX00_001609 [Menopon gallinae]|uniref:Uncharacterized protein n=1 Tax=Menopon gallinae TaxID=328185 RepID=A0AAW2IDA8_9NEOP
MNKTGDSLTMSSGEKLTPTEKSITPAILGIPSVSHGAKISLNMNSKDKDNLLMQLEQWRQKRKDKLTARILGKNKPMISPKVLVKPKPKPKLISNPLSDSDGKPIRCSPKKSVFERLSEKDSRKDVTKKIEEKFEKPFVRKTPSIQPFSIEEIEVPEIVVSKCEEVVDVRDACELKSDPPKTVTEGDQPILSEETQSSVAVNSPEKSESGSENEVNVLPCDNDNIVENECVEVEVKEAENVKQPDEMAVNKNEGGKKVVVSKVKSFKIPRNGSMKPKAKAPLRRSISLIFRQKKGNYESAIHRTMSEDNINKLAESSEIPTTTTTTTTTEPIKNEVKTTEQTVITKVEKATVATPKPSLISSDDLRSKLENWLIEKGQSIDTYKHLQCFGLNMEKTPMHRVQKIDESINASLYSTAPNTPLVDIHDESDKENVTPPVLPKADVKDIEGYLSDLYRLIVHVKYPTSRCEEWLNAISKKFPNCKKLPVFWECEAAIYGDPTELKTVPENQNEQDDNPENSLTQMLDKLVIAEKCHSASKTERGLSMENIFKSKTVKFALKEMKVKQTDPTDGKGEKMLVATPVRRSARLQTPYKSNIVGSLKSLDPETRRKVSFQPNDALLTG